MSGTLRIWSVNLDELRAVPGSGDAEIVRLVREEEPYFLDEYNEWRDDYNENDVEPGKERFELELADVVQLLVDGQPLTDLPERAVDDVYQAVCWALGDSLDLGMRWTSGWNTHMRDAIRQAGVPLDLFHLVFGRTAFPLPRTDMGWGMWTPEQIAAAAGPFEAVDLAALDHDTRETMTAFRKWVRHAAERKGDALIGMYS